MERNYNFNYPVMLLSFQRRIKSIHAGFKKRVPLFGSAKLSKYTSGKVKKSFKSLLGLLCIIGSLFFANLANDWTARNAIQKWNSANGPSLGTLKLALTERNFTQLVSTNKIHKILRGMPLNLDLEGKTWISTDKTWLVFFLNNNSNALPLIFFHNSSKGAVSQLAWEPIDTGWLGFEQLTLILDTAKLPQPKITITKKQNAAHDPRAIYY